MREHLKYTLATNDVGIYVSLDREKEKLSHIFKSDFKINNL